MSESDSAPSIDERRSVKKHRRRSKRSSSSSSEEPSDSSTASSSSSASSKRSYKRKKHSDKKAAKQNTKISKKDIKEAKKAKAAKEAKEAKVAMEAKAAKEAKATKEGKAAKEAKAATEAQAAMEAGKPVEPQGAQCLIPDDLGTKVTQMEEKFARKCEEIEVMKTTIRDLENQVELVDMARRARSLFFQGDVLNGVKVTNVNAIYLLTKLIADKFCCDVKPDEVEEVKALGRGQLLVTFSGRLPGSTFCNILEQQSMNVNPQVHLTAHVYQTGLKRRIAFMCRAMKSNSAINDTGVHDSGDVWIRTRDNIYHTVRNVEFLNKFMNDKTRQYLKDKEC